MTILLSLPRSHGDPFCYDCMFTNMQSHRTHLLRAQIASRGIAFLDATGSPYKHIVFFWQDFKQNLNSVNTILKNKKCLLVLSNTYTV